MAEAYYLDAFSRIERRNRNWYKENLLTVLESAKEKQAREIDASIAIGKDLLQLLNEPRRTPDPVPPHDLVSSEADCLMKPIEPEILHLLYGSTEKGAAEKYLKARNSKAPEDNHLFASCRNVFSKMEKNEVRAVIKYLFLKKFTTQEIESLEKRWTRFYYRATTNWEYGWQQKQSRIPARDTNQGRCAILRDTFYRKSNLAPDPQHYAQPAGGEFSICSVYSCNFN